MKKTITGKRFYIVYVRFSPRPDAENCESCQIQTELCRAYVAKQGGEIVSIHSDPELSGADWERPGLYAAMDALRPGYTLLVWKSDRLCRDGYLSEYLAAEIRRKKARFATVETGDLRDLPQDELIRRVLAAVDDCNRKVGNYRTRVAMLRHQNNNRAMGSVPPYGKRRGEDRIVVRDGVETLQRRWEDDPEEMAIVARIVNEFQNQGKSLSEIVRGLTAEGVPSRGEGWSTNTVKRIVRRAGCEREYAKG